MNLVCNFLARPVYMVRCTKLLAAQTLTFHDHFHRTVFFFQDWLHGIYRQLPFILTKPVFTARCYASAVLAMGLCPSVCVCLSVTSRCSTKTAKRRITQTTPHHTTGTLVFWCQRSPRNSTGITPYEGAKCRWGGQNRRLSTNNWLYLENGTI